jgi:predicted AAA+ superfamily ATPase
MEKHTIKQILLEQKEEIAQIFIRALVDRQVMPYAKKVFKTDLIKVITGIRRCGKSTICH